MVSYHPLWSFKVCVEQIAPIKLTEQTVKIKLALIVSKNQTLSKLPVALFPCMMVVCVLLVAAWKEKTPWLHWLKSTEGLRETLY